MAQVWIAGCGDLGRAAGKLLVREGHEVLGLRRQPPAEEAEDGIRYAAVDLTDPGSLAALDGAPDWILYTAAAPASTEEAYTATYRRGLECLIDRLRRFDTRPDRLVFVSSTAVYGDAAGGWVNEATPCRPDSFRGRVLMAAERAVLEHPAGRVARLAGIYGPGRAALLRRVRDGRPCRPGQYGNRIHRDDAARMLVHLLTSDSPHRVFLGVDDAPSEECEVMSWLAKRLGAASPPRDAAPGSPRGNKRCSNARLRESGFELLYPTYREGYGAMVEKEIQ